MKSHPLFLCSALLAIAGCKPASAPGIPASEASARHAAPAAAPAAVAPDHGAEHARPAGIAWFDGDVTAALAAAKAADKPVLLYWGAVWCPPCHLLKATVFAQPEFQAKTRLFIPVYLDGDDAGAQRWGDKFKVSGYPTLLALRPDGTEIKRISGGVDLNRYASMLDDALEDQRPASEVLTALVKSAGAATAESCRRIAWNAWDLEDAFDAHEPALARQLLAAAEHCSKVSATLELRLRLYAAAALLPATASGGKAGKPAFSAASQANARRLDVLLADTAAASQELDALRTLDEDFFTAYSRHDAAAALRLAALCEAAELKAAQDPRYPRADQLSALELAVEMRKALPGDDALQSQLEKNTRSRLARELADLPRDPYLRSGVVMTVLETMYAMGDYSAAYDIAKREVESSSYAYYFMSDMGNICEELGRKDEALQWYERAYRESKGPATRFQWGTSYLMSLLRLSPDDVDRISKAGHEVLGELQDQDGAHRRSLTRLKRVDAKLTEWSRTHPEQRATVARDLRAAFPKGA
ncbi:MAG: thioredoxin family protein [Pseudomonadota bacterium]